MALAVACAGGALSGCSQILGIGDFHVGGGDALVDAHVVAQHAYLKASNTGAGDQLGRIAVSADGSTIAIGAPLEDSGSTAIDGNQNDETKMNAGAVYVFARGGASWTQEAYIKADNTDASDQFGFSVALSADGNTLVVGANLEDGATPGVNGNEALNTVLDSGAAYVFARTGSTWAKSAYLKGLAVAASDDFGYSVAISGDGTEIAVGAPLRDPGAVAAAGAVFTYHFNGSAWAGEATVVASNPDANDEFGIALALSTDGTTLVASAPLEDSASTGINGNQSNNTAMDAGAAYAFTRSGSTWTQQAYIKATTTAAMAQLGGSVALAGDGNTLVVGVPKGAAGGAYVYARSGTTWSAVTELLASNADAGDAFGAHVAMSTDGKLIAVSAPLEDSGGAPADNAVMDSGAIYTFALAGTWMQSAYLKAAHPDAGDKLDQVGIGGGVVVAGAGFEDSAATGIDGDQTDNAAMDSGAAYVFE